MRERKMTRMEQKSEYERLQKLGQGFNRRNKVNSYFLQYLAQYFIRI